MPVKRFYDDGDDVNEARASILFEDNGAITRVVYGWSFRTRRPNIMEIRLIRDNGSAIILPVTTPGIRAAFDGRVGSVMTDTIENNSFCLRLEGTTRPFMGYPNISQIRLEFAWQVPSYILALARRKKERNLL